ncbi:cytochrome P450 6j1-like [Hyposmocoma kahamanoa]|uniref:cytochrome P450 6j1-like n=1 Tax=Hyposmocoma kahamanoa TaxID=1477025 RepID=UPI000E6D60BB|nr:cytochrome P450 6j1-like [Hyposmocoma kahamanoa]
MTDVFGINAFGVDGDATLTGDNALRRIIKNFQSYSDKLYAEVKQLQEKFGELDTTVIGDAPFLNALIKETLRFYPPIGWLDRVCSKDYKIDDKLTIPAGTPVYVNGVGMQMDPKYYPDPEKFHPDRFMPENEQNIAPFTYMPFGEGPRVCIGKRFAEVSSRAALAALTLNFKYRPLPDAKIELEKNALFLKTGEILHLKYIQIRLGFYDCKWSVKRPRRWFV